jgi:hypothetical protein
MSGALKNAANPVDVLHDSVSLQPELSEAGVLARNDTYVRAESSTYNPRDRISIFMPPRMSDLRDASLQFQVAQTGTLPTIERGIWNIFNRIRVLIGSTPVVDINQFSILSNIRSLEWPDNYETQFGALAEGYANSPAPSAGYKYGLRLGALVPFLHQVLPLQKLNEQMIIELYLDDPARCMDVAAADGNYSVSNVEYHYSILTMSAAWDALWSSTLAAAPMTKSFVNYSHYSENSLLLNATSSSISLPFRYQSLLGLMKVARNSGTVANQATLDKLRTFNSNGVTQSYYSIDGVRAPLDAKQGVSDFAIDWLDFINKKPHTNIRGLRAFFAANDTLPVSWVTAQYVAQHPKEQGENIVPQGVNTSRGGTSIVLEEQYAAGGVGANQETNHWAVHLDVLRINQNGTVQVFS